MRIKRIFFVTTLMLISTSAFSVSGDVKRIFPASNGVINFQLKNDSCNDEYKYYQFDGGTVQGKNWYSLLLTAAASGKVVNIRFVGDDNPCDSTSNKQLRYLYVNY